MNPATSNLDWLYHAGAVLLAALALALLLWSLFRDRARGRLRCPRCWYDLSAAKTIGGRPGSPRPVSSDEPDTRTEPPPGSKSHDAPVREEKGFCRGDPSPLHHQTKPAAPTLPLTCPECAKQIRKPRQLRKTHRRYRFAALAILLLFTSALIAALPKVNRDGWWSLVPTPVLIDTLPLFGYPSVVGDELIRRSGITIIRGAPGSYTKRGPFTLPLDDQIYLLSRVRKGIPFARPSSKRWRRSLARLLDDLESNILIDDPLDPELAHAIERLRTIPLHAVLTTRPVWPEDVPIWIDVGVRDWWRHGFVHRAEVRIALDEPWLNESFPHGFDLPPETHPAKHNLSFHLTLSRPGQSPGSDGTWEPDEHREASVSFIVRGEVHDLISPVSDPEIDALVAWILPRVSLHSGGSGGWSLDSDSFFSSKTRSVALGAIMEFICDGAVIETYELWMRGGDEWFHVHDLGRGHYRQIRTTQKWNPVLPASVFEATPDQQWSVRLRSDPHIALRVIDATHYWQGDITTPFTIEFRDGPPRKSP